MKRLVKNAKHDWHNRDTAIVIFGDKVYENTTHGMCLQQYLNDNNSIRKIDLGGRPEVEQFQTMSKKNDGQCVILAHRVDNSNAIYYIYGYDNGKEMSNSEVESELKKIFPDKEIINDLDHEDDGDNDGYDREKNIGKGYNDIEQFEQEQNEITQNTIKKLIDKYSLNFNFGEVYGHTRLSNGEVIITLKNFNDYEDLDNGTVYNVDFIDFKNAQGENFNLDKLEDLLAEISSTEFKNSKLFESCGFKFVEVYDDSTFVYEKDGLSVGTDASYKEFSFFTEEEDFNASLEVNGMETVNSIDENTLNEIYDMWDGFKNID